LRDDKGQPCWPAHRTMAAARSGSGGPCSAANHYPWPGADRGQWCATANHIPRWGSGWTVRHAKSL